MPFLIYLALPETVSLLRELLDRGGHMVRTPPVHKMAVRLHKADAESQHAEREASTSLEVRAGDSEATSINELVSVYSSMCDQC
jgi:hypothetical protein